MAFSHLWLDGYLFTYCYMLLCLVNIDTDAVMIVFYMVCGPVMTKYLVCRDRLPDVVATQQQVGSYLFGHPKFLIPSFTFF